MPIEGPVWETDLKIKKGRGKCVVNRNLKLTDSATGWNREGGGEFFFITDIY